MAQTTGLCADCQRKLTECYHVFPVENAHKCAFCGKPGVVCDLEPKRRRKPKPQPSVSYGPRANREKYLERRRWA